MLLECPNHQCTKVGCFLYMASKEASHTTGWLFFGGCNITERSNITNATGNVEPNHQYCKMFFVPCMQLQRMPAMPQVGWFFGRCDIKRMLPMLLELHQCCRLSVFLTLFCRRPTTLQVDFLGGMQGIKGGNIAMPLQTQTQTTNAAGRFFLDMSSKEARNAAGWLFLGVHGIGGECCPMPLVMWSQAPAPGLFFGCGIVGQQCHKLIFLEGCSIKAATWTNAPDSWFFLDAALKEAAGWLFFRWSSIGGGKIAMPLECGAKPPMPQVNSFFGCGIKGGQQHHRLIVFWRDVASKEGETLPMLLQTQNQTTNTTYWFFSGCGIKGPATLLADYFGGGCGIEGGNIANATGIVEMLLLPSLPVDCCHFNILLLSLSLLAMLCQCWYCKMMMLPLLPVDYCYLAIIIICWPLAVLLCWHWQDFVAITACWLLLL